MKNMIVLFLTSILGWIIFTAFDGCLDGSGINNYGPPQPPFTCPTPTLVSPGNGDTAVSLTPQLRWLGCADKSWVELRTLDSLIYDDTISSQTECQIPPETLILNTTYYWRVTTWDSVKKKWTFWSNNWHFTTRNY